MRLNNYTKIMSLPGESDVRKCLYNLYTGMVDLMEKDETIEENLSYLSRRLYLQDNEFDKYLKMEKAKLQESKGEVTYYLAFNSDCNAGCSYCFEKKYKSGKRCNLENFLAKLENIKRNNDKITLYGGEPLILSNYSYIVSLFDYCSENNLKISIITNGYELDKYIDLMLKHKNIFEEISLSFDGNSDYHDSVKGIGFYKKTFKNINLLRSRGIGCRLEYRLNLSLDNIDKYDRFVEDIVSLDQDREALVVSSVKYTSRRLSLLNLYRQYKRIESLLPEKIETRIENAYIARIENLFSEDNFILSERMCDESCKRIITDDSIYYCNESLYNEKFEEKHYIKSQLNEKCFSCEFVRICAGNCRMENEYYGGLHCLRGEIDEVIKYVINNKVSQCFSREI